MCVCTVYGVCDVYVWYGLLYVLYVRGYGLCDLLSNAFGKRSIMYCMLRVVGCALCGFCDRFFTIQSVCTVYSVLDVLYVGGCGLCDLLTNAFENRSIMYCVLRVVYTVRHTYTVCIVWYTVCIVCWGLWVVRPFFKRA